MDQIPWRGPDRRKDPNTRQRIDEHPLLKYKIEHARNILAEESAGIALEKKCIDAILANRVKVFFSYKFVDTKAATTVVDELLKYAGGKLEVTIAENFKQLVGTDYAKAIRKAISEAHWFILLLPDPAVDWDWCLFETGMFRRGMLSDKVEKLICLHHPTIGNPHPPQISEFQAVSADTISVKEFLQQVFINPNPVPGMDAINPDLKDQTITEIAEKIVSAISPPVKREYLGHSISIALAQPKTLENLDQLKQAKILTCSDDTCKIFGMRTKPNTWAELTSTVSDTDTDTRWQCELRSVIFEAANGRTFTPIQATFQAYESTKVYRPVLRALDRTVDGTIKVFHIEFVEEVGDFGMGYIPLRVRALVTMLKMVYRFRWEVLEKYENKSLDVKDVTNLSDTLQRIETEAMSRGVLNPQLVCTNFDDNTAVKLMDLFTQWIDISNESKTGELDIALQEKDARKTQAIIPKLAELNRRIMELSATRLEEISK
jgi:hypothetical protein